MTKKLITLLLALTMVFACAVPSFAVTANSIPVVGGDSYYLQGSASSYAVTDAITVHVYINSGTYQNSSSVKYGPIDAVYDVTLTPTQSTTYSRLNPLSDSLFMKCLFSKHQFMPVVSPIKNLSNMFIIT